MADTWVVDMQRYVEVRDPEAAARVSASARRLGEYLGSIVECVSAGWDDVERPIPTTVRCRRRPGRKPCPGHITARRAEEPVAIHWQCDTCDDRGVIRKWQETPWDLSSVSWLGVEADDGRRFRSLKVDEAEYEAIRATLIVGDVAGRVVRAARRTESDDILIEAPDRWMVELVEALAAEVNHMTDKEQRTLLDAVLARV